MKTLRILPLVLFAGVLVCAAGQKPSPREIITLPEIEFPVRLLHRGVTTGEVHVLVKIGPDGRLIDTLVTAYTHKILADATLAALAQGTFRPLEADGQPVTTLTALVLRFETSGMLVVERLGPDSTELRPGVFAYQPCDPKRLDQPLQAISTRSPDYPREFKAQGVRGSVVLVYYVDETGRVRMPMVDRAENDLLAGLSLQAVEQWRFTPPTSARKPVLVRVRQEFEFVPGQPG
jgi:TonB family protein